MRTRDGVCLLSFLPEQHHCYQSIQTSLKQSGYKFSNAEEASLLIILIAEYSDELVTRLSGLNRENALVLAVLCEEAYLSLCQQQHLLKTPVQDILVWSSPQELITIISAHQKKWMTVKTALNSEHVKQTLIGCSHVWKQTLSQLIQFTLFGDQAILLQGETGTGKENMAYLVHLLKCGDTRGQFAVVDCASLSAELVESELFGHEKGAFTHAQQKRDGAFKQANGGTLFLDELGEMPLVQQAKLLRVLQEKSYRSVGSDKWQSIDFRLVSATNRQLFQEVQTGNFRQDLHYRVSGHIITLPALRQRKEDILPLVKHFLSLRFPSRFIPELSPFLAEFLLSRDYPGNVRELEHLVSAIVSNYSGAGPLSLGCVPQELHGIEVGHWSEQQFTEGLRFALAQGVGLKDIKEKAADRALLLALELEQQNVERAAARLRITTRAAQMRKAQLPLA